MSPKPPTDTRVPRRPNWLRRSAPPLVLIVACWAAYANSLAADFVFDDQRHILENASVRDLADWRAVLGATRRPVVNLTLAVNYALGGADPAGYHAFNVVIHMLAALTLFGVVRRTLLSPRFGDRLTSSATSFALAVALLWSVHPLLTQSVTYVIQRGESLMGLFYLLTLYGAIRAATSSRGVLWGVASVVACALGMATKGVMVTAPVMVVLYDYVFLGDSLRAQLRRRWPLYVGLLCSWGALALVGVAQGVLSTTSYAQRTVGFGFKGATPTEYLATQGGVLLHYLRLSLFPYPLCLDYGWPFVRDIAHALPALAAVGAAALVGVVALLRRSWAGFLVVWFFLVLAPTSSIVPIRDPIFEHRMYLPLAAIVALVVAVAFAAVARWRLKRLGVAALTLVTLLLIGMTAARNTAYSSNLTMWRDVAAKAPNNARAWYGVAHALEADGRWDEAIDAWRRAVQAAPDSAPYAFNLAETLTQRQHFAEAIPYYQAGLKLEPTFAKGWRNLGFALLQSNRGDDATSAYAKAVELQPESAGYRLQYAQALACVGRENAAAAAYERVLTLQPGATTPTLELCQILARQKRWEECAAKLRAALAQTPTDPRLNEALGRALTAQGEHAEAVNAFGAAVAAEPESATLRILLAQSLYAAGRPTEAAAAYETALEREPRHVGARFNLGQVYRVLGRLQDAAEQFEAVLELDPNNTLARQALTEVRQQQRSAPH